MEETHEQLNYNLIELDSASIKNAYNFFLYEHADFFGPINKTDNKTSVSANRNRRSKSIQPLTLFK